MLVKNEISGKERQFCVNYQQWRSDFIAESAIQAVKLNFFCEILMQ